MFDVMGIEQLPPVLYQYTSVESLRRILESRSIRFSRLDSVNDPEEAIASDVPLAASSVFVSCWSSVEAEQIPMWSMYGDRFCGVRMRLPANMFAGRREPVIYEKGGALTIFDGSYTILRKAPAMQTQGCAIIGPNKVYYSDDASYRSHRLVYHCGDTAAFYPYDLGMVKSTHWSYEQEWRFKIAALAFEAEYPNDKYFNEVTLDFERYPIENNALFVPLDESALADMEVTVGPKITKASADEVGDILREFAPRASLVPSQLRIR
ncbi:DUF2971 domain-containing protein [Methyloceanibacter sp. wino2]|uniref:DUF2971 domain-containing protein n=1 Tax=Methyloceanibacter sp. wino2 TaxID=2170729 RepID=UPI00131EEB0F|nr:DUF2971 domain-containing protein [Methyloceanibacter sp. wino2]